MGADRFELADLQATVAVVSGAARAPSVEIDYEGTSPPLELFTTLGALGFEGLVPQPPPSASIDWSAGNGQPRILPFRASARGVFVGAVDERGAAVAAVTMVVRRLGQAAAASVPVAVGEPVALTSVPSAPSPSARRAGRSVPPAVVPFPGVEQAAAPRPATGGARPEPARSVGPEPRPTPPTPSSPPCRGSRCAPWSSTTEGPAVSPGARSPGVGADPARPAARRPPG